MNDEKQDAAETPVESDAAETPKKKKRPKMTFKEQMRELKPLFYVLIIAGIGYGGYMLYGYTFATAFTLEDQFQKEIVVDYSDGRPHVLIFADREGGAQVVPWALRLIEEFGEDVAQVRIIDMSAVEGRWRSLAQMAVRNMTEEPVLMDWEAEIWKKYRCEAGMANLFVVGKSRLIKSRVRGEMTDESWKKIAAAIKSSI